MTPEDWQRIKRIVAGAHERPRAERGAFVAEACAGNAWLQWEVESLLHSTEAAADLYETPAVAVAGGIEALAAVAAPQRAAAGDRIGPYRVVRELGRGGMGAVYLAERADGEFEQQVAIKFVGGARNPALLRRFREERRILAALHHPNIAGLLDGGATADGTPYVIMEYVAGLPIDEFCDRAGLATRDRLGLFLAVCAAVQYAHSRLVIHRDIKATNILVTTDGTPKLLDFGIATVIEGAGGARLTTLRALTPESASPEQLRGELITVGSDVYALGVLLYRLVTGCSPYGDAVESDAALLHAICDETPTPPGIDRDLDAIVMKALRKEPERRYTSVEQFSADLQRYLAGRPVLARPDSARYRTVKFLRRHRVPAAAAAVALIAVVAGTAGAIYQARVARRERAVAERRLADLRRLTNSFVFEFHDAIADLPGTLTARKLVVARAAAYLDSLASEGHDDVSLQRELAAAYVRLGDITGGAGSSNLGDLTGALERYRTALRIREALIARSVVAEDVGGLAEVHVRISRSFAGLGDFEQSQTSAQAAVRLLNPAASDAPRGVRRDGQLATAYQQLGFVQLRRGDAAGAGVSLHQALARAQSALAAHPGDARETARLARIAADYAEALLAMDRAAEALEQLHAAEEHLERLLASEPLNQRYRQTRLLVANLRGSALQRVDDAAGAIAAYRTAVRMADALQAEAPDDQGSRIAAALSHHSLGAGLARQGSVEGIAHLRLAMAQMRELAGGTPNDWNRFQLAATAVELSRALFRSDPRHPTACREAAPGIAAWRDLVARNRVPGGTDRSVFAALADRCDSN